MKAPDKIYLQIDGDSFGEWEGATWCQDKINDTDVEYVRADTIPRSSDRDQTCRYADACGFDFCEGEECEDYLLLRNP